MLIQIDLRELRDSWHFQLESSKIFHGHKNDSPMENLQGKQCFQKTWKQRHFHVKSLAIFLLLFDQVEIALILWSNLIHIEIFSI